MEHITYTIPSLAGNGDTGSAALTQDLLNALTVLDGVGQVDVDRDGQNVTVHFDPEYMDRDTLNYYIKGTGYPVTQVSDAI